MNNSARQPILSIIIPVFNNGAKAQIIIAQILKQKHTDFELILVNDGSSDDSLEYLKKFKQQDKRIKLIDQPNGGPSSARNAGLKTTRGHYVMFFDSDDAIAPTMIFEMMHKITTTNSDLVACAIKFITLRHNKPNSTTCLGVTSIPEQRQDDPFKKHLIRLLGNDGRLYSLCNKIFRADLIKKHHIKFQSGLDFGEDLTFNLHYLKHCQKINFIYEPLYIYNFDATSGTFGKSSLIYSHRQQNYQELLRFAGPNLDQPTQDLLGWIKFYWFFSFCLAICSSDQKFKSKLAKLSTAKKAEKLPLAKRRKNLGTKKYLTQITIKIFATTTFGLYLLASIANHIKQNRYLANFWRKLQASSGTTNP